MRGSCIRCVKDRCRKDNPGIESGGHRVRDLLLCSPDLLLRIWGMRDVGPEFVDQAISDAGIGCAEERPIDRPMSITEPVFYCRILS